jgi:GNAT superfamily N-acetyltransferase
MGLDKPFQQPEQSVRVRGVPHLNHVFTIEQTPRAEDLAVISEGVFTFGRAQAQGGDAEPLACFLREHGQIIAGATGRTEYRRLFVDYLWVQEDRRGAGLGTAALQHIESAARSRSAEDAQIETLDDRNAALYQSLGYSPVAVIPHFVGPFTRYILRKTL